MFSEKLFFLMNITNTSSTQIAKACKVDRTYISRLKDGSRALPKKPVFLSDMSIFFSKHIVADYQKSVLCGMLKIDSWPENTDTAAILISDWLSGKKENELSIAPLLASFSSQVKNEDTSSKKSRPLPRIKQYYYGAKGKQEAVLQFFKLILKHKEPQTLYLFSDEDMSWLFGDMDFAHEWKTNFTKVLKAGNRVKIIHNIGRNPNEMLEGIAKWIPIYMTGMIEPYYYPMQKENVMQRTFFIAPDSAAVIASSVSGITDGMFNELITDKQAVFALTKEYMNYLKLCIPLMNIITPDKKNVILHEYHDIIKHDGNMIIMSGAPTLLTMPKSVAMSMQDRIPNSRIYDVWYTATSLFRKKKHTFNITEIIVTPNKRLRKPSVLCYGLYDNTILKYTKDEWLAHIDSCEQFKNTHDNYHLILKDDVFNNICLIVKENIGVILIKGDMPNIAFHFTEPRLVKMFWDYLKNFNSN